MREPAVGQQTLAVGAHQPQPHDLGKFIQLRAQPGLPRLVQGAVALAGGVGAHHAAGEAAKIDNGVENFLYLTVVALRVLIRIFAGLGNDRHHPLGRVLHHLVGTGRLRHGLHPGPHQKSDKLPTTKLFSPFSLLESCIQ